MSSARVLIVGQSSERKYHSKKIDPDNVLNDMKVIIKNMKNSDFGKILRVETVVIGVRAVYVKTNNGVLHILVKPTLKHHGIFSSDETFQLIFNDMKKGSEKYFRGPMIYDQDAEHIAKALSKKGWITVVAEWDE